MGDNEAVCNGNPCTCDGFPPKAGMNPGPLDQQASAKPIALPGLHEWRKM